MGVKDRLARLLFIVPHVANEGGVSIKELARTLEVPPRQIKADIELLMMVGHPPLTPDHLIDMSIEDDMVYVELDQNLSRPLRLTRDEAQALALASKLVGDLGGLGRRLEEIVDKLLAHLPTEDADRLRSLGERILLSSEGSDSAEPLSRLRQAIEECLEIEMEYYSVTSDQKKRYRLQPLALVNHTGTEYLVALDTAAALQEKLFRPDRMQVLTLCEEHFTRPDDLDLEKFRRPSVYEEANSDRVEVIFRSAVSSRLQGVIAPQKVETLANGDIRASLLTSSSSWLARWVMPFGVDAEVVEPESERAALGRLCEEAAQLYADDQV